jgi:DNA-binding beta-propeller fold protein YncE/signal transduction histidine kinase
MLTKTKTLIDKYTNALVVAGLLLVVVVTLSGKLSLGFGKGKQTAKAAAPVVTTTGTVPFPYDSISSAALQGSVSSPGNIVTDAGFEYGLDTSYGNTVSSNFPQTSNTYSTAWGGNSNPYGVAVDSSGDVFVSQSSANKIQKFSNVGNPLSQFGSSGSGNGQFNSPKGIAIDSTGNIFVADSGNNRIQKFNSSGVYQSQFGSAGSGNGQFNTPTGLALDASGNIYVADTGNQRIQKFDSAGVYQSQFGSAGSGNGQFANPTNLAINSSGTIFVADNLNNRIQAFDSSGVYLSKFGTYPYIYSPNGIAISSNGYIYIADTGNNRIRVYNSEGTQLYNFSVTNPPGLAFGPNNALYVTSFSLNNVYKYTSYQYFDGGFGAGALGLTCNTTYHFRAYATNSDGTSYGEDQTFNIPCISIESFDVQTDGNNWTSLFLKGRIFNSSSDITARGFQWGTDTSYGNAIYDTGTPPFPLGQYDISSSLFSCATTYHMRAYATNSQGTYYGNDYEFNFYCMEIINYGSDSISDSAANLNGNIGYSNGDVTARGFEYGPDTSYGNTITDPAPPPYSALPIDYSLVASNLDCNTTYHFRPYATNSHGTFYGDDDTFTTLGCTTVNTLTASGVGSTSAMLNGDLTETLSAIVGQGFQLGTSTSYGTNITYTPSATSLGYKLQWGSYGNADGQFDRPQGLARDNAGNVYVVDSGNNRIQKFDSQGNYLGQFGSPGSGDGQFSYPSGVAIGPEGKIYVADCNNSRVQIFDSSFNYLSQFGSFGSGNGEFDCTWNLVFDNSNNLYVLDAGNNRVQKFDSAGNYLGQFGSYGSGDEQFAYPLGLYVSDSGNIYVGDTNNHRVQIFDSSFNYLGQFGTDGTGDGQFSYIYAITMDNHGKLYVADEGPSVGRVQVFDSAGNYLSQFGSYGSGDGQFRGPEGLATDNSGNIFVSDYFNNNIQVFGPAPAYSTGPYSTQASGLTCGTTYHYRAYVTNQNGTYYGSDQTFNTQGCPYVPAGPGSTTPTAKVNPNPVPAVDLKFLSAIGRLITLKSAPGGILGYIYRFLQALPHSLAVLLPYLVLIFILVIALIYALEAMRERILAIVYTKQAMDKANTLMAEKNILASFQNLSRTITDKITTEMKLLLSAGLLNRFEQSAINDSTKQIIKQSQVLGWTESNTDLAGSKSLHQGGWAQIGRNLLHPLLWAPILILTLVSAGLDIIYRNFGIAEISSLDIRLQLVILAVCSLILAIVWLRLVYNRNTRQNASGELSKAILLMRANASILSEAVEKNEMQIDEISSVSKKLNRKDGANDFVKSRDELASLLRSLAIIQALNMQTTDNSTSQTVTKSIRRTLADNKQPIAQRKLRFSKDIQKGLKIGLPTPIMASLLDSNLTSAIKMSDKNSTINISLKSSVRKINVSISYKGSAIPRRTLHLLEDPSKNFKSLDAFGVALYTDKVITESIGGKFDIVSDSKYGTTVRIKLPKADASVDGFKPINKEADNPDLALFNGKAKPA